MEEPEMYRRAMLSDQSSTTAAASSSSNLRDLLTRQEEDLLPLRRQVPSLSLGTVLACEKRELSRFTPELPVVAPPPAAATTGSRTLLDIIRDEEFPGGGRSLYDGVIIGGSNGGHKIGWRAFKDRLRVRRAGAGAAAVAADPPDGSPAAASIHPPPSAVSSSSETLAPEASAAPGNNPSPAVSVAGEAARTPAPETTPDLPIGAPSAEEQGEGSNSTPATSAATGTTPPPQPIRVSLMTLLEQTNRQGEGPGFAVSALWEAERDEEDGKEAGEEEEGGGDGYDGGKIYVKCCVCMVRHKGAAFIPCGHTFCRRCSRELWVSRGSCPLCNGFILEILDIF